MGNGSALEVVLHDDALYKSTTLLFYFTFSKGRVQRPSRHIIGHFGDNFTGRMTQPIVIQLKDDG